VSAINDLLDKLEADQSTDIRHGLDCLSPETRAMGEAIVENDIAMTDAARAELAALRAENERLRIALALLVEDVQGYEAWQRPCYALDTARAALSKEKR